MHAAFALGELGVGDPDCAEEVARAVADPSVQVRREAVEALGLIDEPADVIVAALADGLTDADGQGALHGGALSAAAWGETLPRLSRPCTGLCVMKTATCGQTP